MPEILTVEVPRLLSADEATAMVGDDVPPAEPTLTGATVAVDADTQRPVFAYLPLPQVAELRRAVIRLDYGEGMIRANGVRNRARAFGYGPRRPVYRREGCSATALANEFPREHQVITGYADQLAAMLPLIDRDLTSAAKLAVAEVSPDWRLGRSKLWTSGVINQSAVLPWHRDAFNFPAWSAMPVLRRHIDGGYLRILEYGAVIPCRDGWGVFFAGYELVHGVTPMRLLRDDGYRYSIVYYALKGMKNCQPTGTPVRIPAPKSRADGGGRGRQRGGFIEVPIETLSVGDKVVTWGRQSGDLRSRGRQIARAGSRPYEGPLITVEVDGRSSRYTPDHHCIVDFGAELKEGKFIVYLMRRNGQYRIGRTVWGANGNGLRSRTHQENADCAWILAAHHTAAESGLTEAVASTTFGLPEVSFVDEAHYAFPLDAFWDKIGDNRAQAEACLTHFARLIDCPLIRRPERPFGRWLPPEGVAAANLMSGMLLPVPADKPTFVREKGWQRWPTTWEATTVGREFYSGLVHSLEVEQDHNYVADGIVTHNCFEAAEETRYAKRRRTEREQDMAANLAAGNKQIHNLSPGRGAGLRTMGGRQQAQFPKVGPRAGDPTAIEDAYVTGESP